ncbi:hypothetical protein A6X21_08405 [Planctopirus hydrillae]|uniref:Uncharacterized protein n=1 Tax=Planctopirus hydrillae TaxID=1841610 RepID=A0A1C3E894_9PLAN|nr:hypothetical protein A6X21_08405 [Planctopirus hydrillae]
MELEFLKLFVLMLGGSLFVNKNGAESFMKCPRCKTTDVYRSRSAQAGVLSLVTTMARCHRCCHLFRVAAWNNVPDAPPAQENQTFRNRRAA